MAGLVEAETGIVLRVDLGGDPIQAERRRIDAVQLSA